VIHYLGVHVNGIEYPVVKIGQARLRVSLMPQHTYEQLDKFVEVFEKALAKANSIYERDMQKYMDKMA
jgi:glycine C-acetyltransferase